MQFNEWSLLFVCFNLQYQTTVWGPLLIMTILRLCKARGDSWVSCLNSKMSCVCVFVVLHVTVKNLFGSTVCIVLNQHRGFVTFEAHRKSNLPRHHLLILDFYVAIGILKRIVVVMFLVISFEYSHYFWPMSLARIYPGRTSLSPCPPPLLKVHLWT